jgi:RND family efflux transporter MFP subunit
MKTKTILVILSSCIFTLCTSIQSQSEHSPPQQDLPEVAVHVQTAKETSTQPQVEMVATIEAVEQAAIAAKVTGTIIELPVVLGSRVSKGDTLARISADEISARVLQAQAQLTQAKRNLNREQKLLKRNATTKETVNSLRDMFSVAKASLQEAKTMLGYTTILAPFNGVVTQKFANSGDLATPGVPLVQLENDASLQAVTAVPESLIHYIKSGDKLTVEVPSAQLTLTGTVAEIAPAANPQSRTAPVKINIEYNTALRTGQFARVILPVALAKTLFIAKSAVIPFGQMDKVFVVEDGKAKLRLVRTGSQSGDLVEILAGITDGDRVIVENNTLLTSGQPVTVNQ